MEKRNERDREQRADEQTPVFFVFRREIGADDQENNQEFQGAIAERTLKIAAINSSR